jgi:hypothetical protein
MSKSIRKHEAIFEIGIDLNAKEYTGARNHV